ncbi:MAG: glycolate oxidase subunit GlcE [Rhodoferax sp.]|nr:glycolate oxidase subunit GlcE [Rhodoferax sp.]
MSAIGYEIQRLIDRVRTAAADRTPLRIRGGGSKDFYGNNGNTLQGNVLETTALRGVISYEPSELVVTVAAGTPLVELESLLAEHRQCLAFEPPHFSAGNCYATVGGMIAAGLAGPARASVGAVRDYVLGLQMVNGQCELLTFGGQVMKNVAGYDISRLMVGAMGTLGLLTQVSIKVMPMAPAEATLCFELPQAVALEQLHRWAAQPLPLNASCWVCDAGRELLFVRLRGAHAAVESACRSMLTDQNGIRMDNTQAQADWQLCRNQQLPFFSSPQTPDRALWRLSVAQTAPPLELPWPQLVEWHGGLRWLWAPPDAAPALRQAARVNGGSATLFAASPARPISDGDRFDLKNLGSLAIQRRLKERFDPQGIFNPGRLFDAW